jgi:hypothetical protein
MSCRPLFTKEGQRILRWVGAGAPIYLARGRVAAGVLSPKAATNPGGEATGSILDNPVGQISVASNAQ